MQYLNPVSKITKSCQIDAKFLQYLMFCSPSSDNVDLFTTDTFIFLFITFKYPYLDIKRTCFWEISMLQSYRSLFEYLSAPLYSFCLPTFLTTTLKNTSKKSFREERLFDHSFDHNYRKSIWNQRSCEFRKPCNIVNKRTKTSRKN